LFGDEPSLKEDARDSYVYRHSHHRKRGGQRHIVVANDESDALIRRHSASRSEDASNNAVSNQRKRSQRPKHCASVEEMGLSAAGNVVASSLRFRRLINAYLSEHGNLL
jgi:hypothetical protein